MKPIDIELNGFNKQVIMTVHIKLTRRFLVRKWIALRLIQLASWLVGCEFAVKDENEARGNDVSD